MGMGQTCGGNNVRIEEYAEHLQTQGLPSDEVEKKKAIVADLASFLVHLSLEDTAAVGKEHVDKFARQLIADGRNTPENFSALRDYAVWLGHRKIYVALIELMDGRNAMAVLADAIEAKHGRKVRERVFREALPPLGADEKERCAHARMILERMAQELAPEDVRAAWFRVQHGISADAWRKSDTADKEKFKQCDSIDEFLDLQRRERDAFLTRLRDEGKLWYTVVIDDEVLEFIKSDPETEAGRREGDRIYITKVPYNAVRYLHATDTRMKRYYACHCPMLREAILQDKPISPDACSCSLGHASHYLAGLGMEVRGEVLESAVKGDARCRFVFYLPNKGE
jgi:hypothetical protein